MRDAEKTIGNLMDKQSVCFLGAIDKEGFPSVKAMLQPREREGTHTFWLTTNTSSLHVAQYRENPAACLYFCDRRFFRGALLTGTIEILTDSESRYRIWREGDTAYYPQGPDDPDYCVLRFTARSGRYYHNFKSEDFAIQETIGN